MSAEPFPPPDDVGPEEVEAGVTERVFDNLAIWAFVAMAIAVLYMVWATIEIVMQLTGDMPGMGA